MQPKLTRCITMVWRQRSSSSHATVWIFGNPWFGIEKRLPRGARVKATVTNVREFGWFDRVEVQILWVDGIQHKMGLKLLSKVEEDVGDLISGQHRLFH
jgi:hypothetical protein